MRIGSLTALALTAIGMATPALAASGPFLSLRNTNFVVLLAFILFVAVLVYLRVPALVAGMLDKRAERIRNELDEARRLREEAQELLASYERKQREVEDQAMKIVETARQEAEREAAEAREELKRSVARRLAAAEEQIALAEAKVLKEVRNQAVDIAVEAARDVIAAQIGEDDVERLVEESISEVKTRLH